MIRSARLRARSILARHGTTLAVLLVLVGALCLGGAGWLYTHPPTTEVTDHTHRQTIGSNVSTETVVAANASLYEPGRVLTNEPVYLGTETRSLTLVQTTTVPERRQVTVDQRLVVTYTAERDGDVFWQDSTVLNRTETTTQSGRVGTRTRLDPERIRKRLETVRQRIGDAGSVAVTLRLVVAYDTPRYGGTLTDSVGLQLADEWYRIGSASVSRTHTTPATRTVTVPGRQREASTGLGVAGAIALLLGAGIGLAGRVGPWGSAPGDTEFELHRLRYAEWISSGTLPENAGETVVAVASLEALVDVAIDTEKRVIHDPSRGRYAVIDGTTVYYYERARPQ